MREQESVDDGRSKRLIKKRLSIEEIKEKNNNYNISHY